MEKRETKTGDFGSNLLLTLSKNIMFLYLKLSSRLRSGNDSTRSDPASSMSCCLLALGSETEDEDEIEDGEEELDGGEILFALTGSCCDAGLELLLLLTLIVKLLDFGGDLIGSVLDVGEIGNGNDIGVPFGDTLGLDIDEVTLLSSSEKRFPEWLFVCPPRYCNMFRFDEWLWKLLPLLLAWLLFSSADVVIGDRSEPCPALLIKLIRLSVLPEPPSGFAADMLKKFEFN